MNLYTHHCVVFLSNRQGAWCQGQSIKDAMMNTHRLILLKHTVGNQLGQPDVEQVVALCLNGRTGVEGGGGSKSENKICKSG